MSEHVTEWLGPYLDGELGGSRLVSIEVHLAECEECQAELESLERISTLLQEAPAPAFIPSEQFALQVRLCLPRREAPASKQSLLEIGWWMVPVGLLAAWMFFSTSFLVDDVVLLASRFGFLRGLADWISPGAPSAARWSLTLGQLGMLSGRTLDIIAFTETFTRTSLEQIGLQVSIALLYLGWMAVWWTRRPRLEGGPLPGRESRPTT